MNDAPNPTLDRMLRAEHTRARLDEIARLIAEGADAEEFDEEMNELLGTKMEERDHEAEASWEDSYRGRSPGTD